MRRAAALAVAVALSVAVLAVALGDGDGGDGTSGDLVDVGVRRADDVPPDALAWDVRYLSADVDGDLVEVTGVVFAPRRPGRDRPVVTWAHGTTGIADACAPSRQGTAVPWLPQLLAAGYVVAASDYQGLGTPGPHPYLVGRSEAHSILDAARAASAIPGAGAGSQVVVLGYSQGGHAALFAAEVATRYAPDLDVAGAVAIAPVADLGSFLSAARVSPRTFGFFVATALAWSETYDALELGDVLSEAGVERSREVAAACGAGLTGVLRGADLAALRGPSPASVPRWRPWLAANEPGRAATTVPVLVTTGTADGVVPSWTTDRAVDRLCHIGTVVEHRRYAGADHGSVVEAGRHEVLDWVAARIAGRPAATACSRGTR